MPLFYSTSHPTKGLYFPSHQEALALLPIPPRNPALSSLVLAQCGTAWPYLECTTECDKHHTTDYYTLQITTCYNLDSTRAPIPRRARRQPLCHSHHHPCPYDVTVAVVLLPWWCYIIHIDVAYTTSKPIPNSSILRSQRHPTPQCHPNPDPQPPRHHPNLQRQLVSVFLPNTTTPCPQEISLTLLVEVSRNF